MFRSTALITVIALCLGCSGGAAQTRNAEPATNGSVKIYEKFLDTWIDKNKRTLNISLAASTPSSDDLKEFSDCAGKNNQWAPIESIPDLTRFVGSLPHVRLVDPEKWSPREFDDLIAQGQSAKSAAKNQAASGLLTLSAIAFDESNMVATFKYSFDCGELCGSGGIVVFFRGQDGWTQSTKKCRGWVS